MSPVLILRKLMDQKMLWTETFPLGGNHPQSPGDENTIELTWRSTYCRAFKWLMLWLPWLTPHDL